MCVTRTIIHQVIAMRGGRKRRGKERDRGGGLRGEGKGKKLFKGKIANKGNGKRIGKNSISHTLKHSFFEFGSKFWCFLTCKISFPPLLVGILLPLQKYTPFLLSCFPT